MTRISAMDDFGDNFEFDDVEATQIALADLCDTEPQYNSRTLSECITDLLARSGSIDEDGRFTAIYPRDALGDENGSEMSPAHHFARTVLRSYPASGANSRTNSNRMEVSDPVVVGDLAAEQPPDQMDEEMHQLILNLVGPLGDLPIDEISASAIPGPDDGSIALSIFPNTDNARESLQSRYYAIQHERHTLHEVTAILPPFPTSTPPLPQRSRTASSPHPPSPRRRSAPRRTARRRTRARARAARTRSRRPSPSPP